MRVEKATAGTHASQGVTVNLEATPTQRKRLDLPVVVEQMSLSEGINRRERESTRMCAYPLDTPRMNIIQCPPTVLICCPAPIIRQLPLQTTARMNEKFTGQRTKDCAENRGCTTGNGKSDRVDRLGYRLRSRASRINSLLANGVHGALQ